ncbi:MAG: PTS sugar transporter subunit IIA [Thermosediminibacteraceae bacterium]|nr:PTS sugar transporter subunit IIA [Thermosediminibacteraceae bacterium]
MKILLVGHGNFPNGVTDVAKMIVGNIAFLKPISFNENDDVSDFENKLKAEIESNSEDVLVLADLFGGSPFNVAMKLASQCTNKRVRVLAGVNLPMILELSSYPLNDCDIDFIVSKLIATGKEGIVEGFQHLSLQNESQ